MSLFAIKVLPVAAFTATLVGITLAVSEVAYAFSLQRTTGPLPPSGVNAPLPAPTIINFNGPGFTGSVPTTPTTLVSGGPNGGATIQKTAGDADYPGNQLRIGTPGRNGTSGTVSFTFDDPRGLGYFGFFLANDTGANEVVSFFRGNSLIQSFTGLDFLAASGNGNYINFFLTNTSEIFDRVDFTRNLANGNAFRVDNVAYQAIPTPALLPGLLAFGVGVLRKRKGDHSAESEV